tara:strand:+ start:113 stop:943 length:831 start_codon:yes stop_codon:yes gene_type:complete
MPIEKTNQIASVINSRPLVFSQCCACFDIFFPPYRLKNERLLILKNIGTPKILVFFTILSYISTLSIYMGLKYRFNLKDIKIEDFKVYLFALFKGILPKKKIRNFLDLEEFIQKKSAWVSQVTLYNYLKTRMGTKYVLHFNDDVFLESINLAKWNIYIIALQDLTFFTFSYIHNNFNLDDFEKSKRIYESILDEELKNGLPEEIAAHGRKTFSERYEKIDWKKYFNSLPFNPSALALYKWAPIADELKTLDRKIVLNSMILKWDNIKDEFAKLIKF